jgi:putative DNA primase/helicase
MSSILETALANLDRGWISVPACSAPCDIPWHQEDGPCQGKRPMVKGVGNNGRTKVTAAEIKEWWRTWPDSQLAVLTGARSDLVVIDIDGPEGEASLAMVEQVLVTLPYTMEVRTKHGRHLYFRHPGGKVLTRKGSQFTTWNDIPQPAPGLDVRGDGGLVIAPPSQDRVLANNLEPTELPAEWVGPLSTSSSQSRDVDLDEAREWLTAGEPDQDVIAALESYDPEHPRTSARRLQVELLGLGHEGHAGTAAAMATLKERAGLDDHDWSRLLAGAPGQVNVMKDPLAEVWAEIEEKTMDETETKEETKDTILYPAKDGRIFAVYLDKAGEFEELFRDHLMTREEWDAWLGMDTDEFETDRRRKERKERVLLDDQFTDARLAERVAEEVMADRFIWVRGIGWMTWDGTRWVESEDETVREAVRLWVVARFEEVVTAAAKEGKTPDRDEVQGWMSAQSRSRIGAITDLTKGLVQVKAIELDASKDLLNTPGGVVDLRTGEIQPARPDLFMTRITSGNYRPGYCHRDWRQALVALKKPERRWLQARIGQAVTGYRTPDGVLPICQGTGNNGKSLILTDGTIPALGDYASMASHKLIQASKGMEHSEEIASLRGKRFMVAEEMTEGRALDVTTIKRIQDVGRVTARHVYAKNMDFEMTHSLFATTNYIPVVNETDQGTWRRLALVRFRLTFRNEGEDLITRGDRRADEGLKAQIEANQDGQHDAIVTWVVEGAMRWFAEGPAALKPTPRITADTRAWRIEADRILGFWDEMLIPDRDAMVVTSEVRDYFNAWLRSNGHNDWAKELFGPRFLNHNETAKHGVDQVRTRDVKKIKRPPSAYSHNDLPKQVVVYRGFRYRTEKDQVNEGVQTVHTSQKLSHGRPSREKVSEGSAQSAHPSGAGETAAGTWDPFAERDKDEDPFEGVDY